MIGISVTLRRRQKKASQPGQLDLTAPVLMALVLDEALQEFSFTTSEAGACHWILDSTTSFADAAALVLAKSAAEASGNVMAVAGANTDSVDTAGVPPGNWRFHVGLIDAAGNASNVLSGNFTITSNELELNGDPLVWNGDHLIFNAA